MTSTNEYVNGHYELEEVPHGKVYKWIPGYALVECDFGQLVLVDHATTTTVTCPQCGADHVGLVVGLEGRPLVEDEVYYPEHLAYEEWRREEKAHPTYHEYNVGWSYRPLSRDLM